MDQGKLFGGGHGGNNDFGTGNFAGGNADRSNLGVYFQEKLKSNPTNSFLLRNYAKYLHEVEGDAMKAKEYYGRAILASLGDGEVLCLYGKLIWEADRDEVRAKLYFDRVVSASPVDCPIDMNTGNVEVRLLPEAAVVSECRSYETCDIVLKIKAPKAPTKAERRAPIDLITVMDVGG